MRLARVAVFLWMALVVVCAARAALRPASHTVYPVYSYAARAWLAGGDLYVLVPQYDYFRYSPLMAATFVPWLALGDAAGGALWRAFGAALLAGGMGSWLRDSNFCERRGLSPPLSPPVIFLLVWPFALQNINNGQSNPHMLGLLLYGVAGATAGRLWQSAVCFALAVLIKPYVLAVALLVAVARPALAPRLAVALSAGVALPFLFQHPAYVAGQYVAWIRHFADNDRSDFPLRGCYRDLALLFRVYLVPLPPRAYHAIQVAAGIAMAAVVWMYRRQPGARATETPSLALRTDSQTIALAFALGSIWVTVFGPATESCTYLLLAPVLAAAVVTGDAAPRLAYALFAVTIAASLFPGDWRMQALGLQPAGGLILLAWMLTWTYCVSGSKTQAGWSVSGIGLSEYDADGRLGAHAGSPAFERRGVSHGSTHLIPDSRSPLP